MRRADRLFEIIQVFRRARGPLTADAIATELETSRRTIYRDITALIAQRVPIRGEAGIGYVLDGGFDLPPLMFNTDEIEAVVLGAQWVAAHGDPALARAAASVLAKVKAVVPEGLRGMIDSPAVGTLPALRRQGNGHGDDGDSEVDVARLRAWSQQGRKLRISYTDDTSRTSERTVWPFLVGFLAEVKTLMAWCELRQDFRIFRIDRLQSVVFMEEHYPERPTTLRRRWKQLHPSSG